MQPLRALIVEDSEDDTLLLVDELRRGGFDPMFRRVASPEAMTAALRAQKWDVVFADYTMPHFKGTDALNLLKESGLDTPFIFVSGTIGEDTAVSSMKAGAHDYIIKGNLKRLVPAVQRELREAEIRHLQRQGEERVRRQQERIRALHEIDLAITSTLELSAVLALLLEKIDLLIPHSLLSTVRLFNRESGQLEFTACRNLDEKEWRSGEWEAGRDLDRVVVEIGSPLMVDNLQSDPRTRDPDFSHRHGLVSYFGVPLAAKGEVLGVLSFYMGREQGLNNEEIEVLITLAGQAALAIHNAQLYEKTKKQAEELEKLHRVKSEFLGVMSHELRTPLNVIIGYTRMVQGKILGEINPGQEQAMRKSLRYCSDLLTMINDILETSRIEAEPVEAQSHEMDLSHFLDELKSAYDVPLDKELTLNWDYPAEFPVVKTDSRKLKHILQNLINNAIKFTQKDTITISARITESGRQRAKGKRQQSEDLTHDSSLAPLASEKWVEFKVADTGIGIPREKIPIIFQMFRQVDSADSRSAGGVGLGLYIVKKFTGMLGGRIDVESEPGKGSNFTVSIPLEARLSPVEAEQGRSVSSIIRGLSQPVPKQKALKQQAAELEQKARQLSALHAVAAAVGRSLDLDVILSESLEKLAETLVLEAARIFIWDESAAELRLRAQRGVSGGLAQARPYRIGEGITGKVFETGEVVLFEDIQTDPNFRKLARQGLALERGFRSFACFPVKVKEKKLGVIQLFGYGPHWFVPEEIELIASMASQIGVAIENAKLFAEVKSKTADLEKAVKVKDEFLRIMSHELRTPLNVVLGYTAMIQDQLFGEINAEQEKALGKVLRHSRDLLAMITTILQAATLETGVVPLERHKVPLSALLDEIKLACEAPLDKGVALLWDYPSDLPVIETDGEKLRYILESLVNNAVKFTEKGRVAVSVRYFPEAKTVQFEVADTGIGIPQDMSSAIFEKFRQVDSSETRTHGGVGIGLFIVKHFSDMLSGKIEAQSEPGKGSTFTVTIPC